MKPGEQKSQVWQYFEIADNDGNKVICTICGKKLSRTNSSTGNMLRHAIHQHQIPLECTSFTPNNAPKRKRKSTEPANDNYYTNDYQLAVIKPEVKSQNSAVVKSTVTVNHNGNENELNGKIVSEMLLDMVIGDGHMMSITQGKYFKKFVENILFGFEVPEENFFVEKMQRMSENLKSELCEVVKFAETASITLETIVIKSNEKFVVLSIHFINTFSTQNESFVLSIKKITDSDTSDHYGLWMKGVLNTFNISHTQIFSICCDDNESSHIGKLCSALSETYDWYNHPCPVRIIQEIIIKLFGLFSEISDALLLIRNIITHFFETPEAMNALENKVKQSMGQGQCNLKLDDPEKWMSTLAMVDKFVELQWPITMVLSELSSTRFKNIPWKLITLIHDVLQPFKVANEIMAGQKFTTLSTLQPVVMGVMKQLKLNLTNSAFKEVHGLCKRAIEELQLRFKFEDLTVNICHKATLLDPRYKTATMSAGLSELVKSAINEDIPSDNTSHFNQSYIQASADDSQEQLINFAFTNQNPNVNCQEEVVTTVALVSEKGSEVEEYLLLPKLPLNGEPLQFWKDNNDTLPLLSFLGRKFLTLPAASKCPRLKQVMAEESKTKIEKHLTSEYANDLFFLYCNRYLSTD